MAPSDNVLRGGLTTKFIDADEFLAAADWTEQSPSLVDRDEHGLTSLATAGLPGVSLCEIDVAGSATLASSVPAIALVLEGEVEFGETSALSLTPGRAVFLEHTETSVALRGTGLVLVACSS